MPSQQGSRGLFPFGAAGVSSFAGQVSSGGIPPSISAGGQAGRSSFVSSLFFIC